MCAGLGVVMAGKGPPPKARRTRPRDEVPEVKIERGRSAPPPMPPGDHLPATIAWWETWVGSEQGEHFTATSWMRLTMLVPIVDLYFANPSKDLLAEIRQNESKLGATPEDLMRLRWKIEEPPPPTTPPADRYAHISVDDL
jgi:hypothetical protein